MLFKKYDFSTLDSNISFHEWWELGNNLCHRLMIPILKTQEKFKKFIPFKIPSMNFGEKQRMRVQVYGDGSRSTFSDSQTTWHTSSNSLTWLMSVCTTTKWFSSQRPSCPTFDWKYSDFRPIIFVPKLGTYDLGRISHIPERITAFRGIFYE